MDTVIAGGPRLSKQGSNQFDTEFHKVHTVFHRETPFCASRDIPPGAIPKSANSNHSVQLCVHFAKLCVGLIAFFPRDECLANPLPIGADQLTKLMIRYNVGCRIEDTLHIKKVDEDFFE